MAPTQPTTSELALSKSVVERFSSEIDVALEYTRTSISSTDAQRRLLEILMVASIIADRMRTLSDARIDDVAQLPELASAMKKLTTQQGRGEQSRCGGASMLAGTVPLCAVMP